MAVNETQLIYGKTQPYPFRCYFFKSARRAVIRPDHLCAWLASFVGKKNQKLFFLFNFWGVIYISMFTYCSIRSVVALIAVSNTTWEFIKYAIVCLYVILGFSFLMLTGNFLVQNLMQVCRNRTQFEAMKGMKPTLCLRHPWWRNWEDVFGPLSKWYMWLWPTPAFPDYDDYELAVLNAERHW
jgi:hypothetical protein